MKTRKEEMERERVRPEKKEFAESKRKTAMEYMEAAKIGLCKKHSR